MQASNPRIPCGKTKGLLNFSSGLFVFLIYIRPGLDIIFYFQVIPQAGLPAFTDQTCHYEKNAHAVCHCTAQLSILLSK